MEISGIYGQTDLLSFYPFTSDGLYFGIVPREVYDSNPKSYENLIHAKNRQIIDDHKKAGKYLQPFSRDIRSLSLPLFDVPNPNLWSFKAIMLDYSVPKNTIK